MVSLSNHRLRTSGSLGTLAWRLHPSTAVSVVGWIALGLLLGAAVGSGLGARGRGVPATAAAGTLGALLAGLLTSVVAGLDVVDVNGTSLVAAGIGALALIGVLQATPDTAYE